VSHGIPVLHETAELLVVAKPEGIATIPERDPAVPSVRRELEAQRGETLWVVHRLDKEVSGVLLFARSAEAHRELCQKFEQRLVQKTYLALVGGEVRKETDVIDMPLRQFGSGRMGVDARGKASQTAYRVRARGTGCTLLEVEPHTGRRHQIRVHLYAIEHPLFGETRYGDTTRPVETPRLMLHAWKLAVSGLSVEAPPPPSFVSELERRGLAWP
jgi:tRNA pseudouridine32 synthase / 23S rRNA pseudouridine746 synthase